jgi:hypothetical protein
MRKVTQAIARRGTAWATRAIVRTASDSKNSSGGYRTGSGLTVGRLVAGQRVQGFGRRLVVWM